MNGICGILRLDSKPIDKEQLLQCAFQSPQWQPDHQGHYIQQKIGLISTQRFMTQECARGLMPYHHPESDCVIVADAWLTNRPTLLGVLSLDQNAADVELVLAAYLKWGSDCTQHLQGPFMFAIWNPRTQALFIATDHFSTRPCLYAYQPGKYFIFANYMTPFRILCDSLTLDESLLTYFALDTSLDEGTSYREIKKILPAHQFIIAEHSLKQERYWRLEKKALPSYRTRDDYYQAFRELFSETVQQYLRGAYPVTAHISGGLDSSAVAAVAANLLLEKNETLHGFTAIPQNLEGQSHNEGWHYHELPRVQTLLQQYSNIKHTVYQCSPLTDPFEEISKFYPLIDQPYLHIINMGWILGCLKLTAANNGRQVLSGSRGNGTISWVGQNIKHFLYRTYRDCRVLLKPSYSMYPGFLSRHTRDFLNTEGAKQAMLHRGLNSGSQRRLIGSNLAKQTTTRPISLWYGVEMLDPTGDIKVVEFCHSIPSWVHFKGRATLERRLLVREALTGIVPEEIRLNPYRGEQGADAYLLYNRYAGKWRDEILRITNNKADHILWHIFDKQKMLGLFEQYQQIAEPDKEIQIQIYSNLMRCLSLGFYLDYLESV